jgi:integrase
MAKPYPRKRADGSLAWYGKVKDESGEWKPQLLEGCKTERQAQKYLDDLRAEQGRLNKGLETGKRFKGTFHELCEWAFDVHFSKLRSVQADRSRINCHAGPKSKLGKLLVERITTAEVQEYLDDYAKTITVRGKPPSPANINRLRAFFSGVFGAAIKRKRWPNENPVLGTIELEVSTLGAETLHPPEGHPTLAMVSAYWRGCCAVGILAGLRKGEILALHKSDIDLARRVILVRRSHQFVGTKGSKGKPESVPLPEALVPYLLPWLETPGPLLFASKSGKQRSRQVHMEQLIRGAMVRAGFCEWYDHKCRRKGCGHSERHADDADRRCPACDMKLWAVGHARHVTFHGGRHTCATLALKAGVGLHSVQRILRHKDPRLTVNTYGHLTVGDLADDLNRVHLPGAPTPGQYGSDDARAAHASQHPPTRCKETGARLENFGAPLVRADENGDLQDGGDATNWLDLAGFSGGADRDRTGDLCIANASNESPPAHPGSHLVVTASDRDHASHPVTHQITPSPEAFGAPLVRVAENAHQKFRGATRGGAAPEAPAVTASHRSSALLTVREVAGRLRVSSGFIYRETNAGRLGSVRVGGSGVRVPEEALDAYLRAFPGLGDVPAPVRSRADSGASDAKPRGSRKAAVGGRSAR